jgi:hypothetical protein
VMRGPVVLVGFLAIVAPLSIGRSGSARRY